MTLLQILDIILFIFILKWSYNAYKDKEEAIAICNRANALLEKAEDHHDAWERTIRRVRDEDNMYQ